MPKAYRLNQEAMAVIMDTYARSVSSTLIEIAPQLNLFLFNFSVNSPNSTAKTTVQTNTAILDPTPLLSTRTAPEAATHPTVAMRCLPAVLRVAMVALEARRG